ncbi:MAG: hypothetical protein OS112_07505 [Methanoregula sp.]|nr:MAG: hypothetical protein OS112_07505 [Methanoregula sp.]
MPGQPPAQERSDKPGASSCQINRRKEQGESVSGAERRGAPASRSAAETNSLDRTASRPKN